MKRLILLGVAAVGVFAGCAQALAAATASGKVSMTVDQRAGINVVTPLVLPTISTTAVVPVSRLGGGVTAISGPVANGSSLTTVNASGAGPLSNATLTIYGQAGEAVSMAVPETFQVFRSGGSETLTVKTSTNSQYNVAGNGVVIGGSTNADTMSVDVGGSLAVASNDTAVPGPYAGLLVVVVQYN